MTSTPRADEMVEFDLDNAVERLASFSRSKVNNPNEAAREYLQRLVRDLRKAIECFSTLQPTDTVQTDAIEALLAEAYKRGWNECCQSMLEDYDISGMPEAPHPDTMGEGCGTFMAEVYPKIAALSDTVLAEPQDHGKLKARAREILNKHLEYMDGLDRGQINMKTSNALAAVEEALASPAMTTPVLAEGELLPCPIVDSNGNPFDEAKVERAAMLLVDLHPLLGYDGARRIVLFAGNTRATRILDDGED